MTNSKLRIEDPWTVRLSPSFLLSDFMYSDTIVRRGLSNVFDGTQAILDEGKYLAESVDRYVQKAKTQTSVTYGYIHPDVSKKTVKWKDPSLPSYHRWDDGAAADFIFHDSLGVSKPDGHRWAVESVDTAFSPLAIAVKVSAMVDFSRILTYSESPGICIGTKLSEIKAGTPRRAFYENRYQGVPGGKPKFIKHAPGNIESIWGELIEPEAGNVGEELITHGWVGSGHPTYHGGGRLQYHHIRIGKNLTLLDCLKCPVRLLEGFHNRPPSNSRARRNFIHVGYAMSSYISAMKQTEWARVRLKKPMAPLGFGNVSVVQAHNPLEPIDSLCGFQDDVKVDRDWCSGQGSMIIAVNGLWASWAKNHLATRKTKKNPLPFFSMYNVDVSDMGSSVFLRVQWRKK